MNEIATLIVLFDNPLQNHELRQFRGAVNALLEDQRSVMIGLVNDEIVYVPFSKAIKKDKDVKPDSVAALQILAI